MDKSGKEKRSLRHAEMTEDTTVEYFFRQYPHKTHKEIKELIKAPGSYIKKLAKLLKK